MKEFKKSMIHDRGVFALHGIQKGTVIEICPVLIFSKEDLNKIDKTNLYNYYFSWKNSQGALALGNGSLYNHSYTPNALYKKNISKRTITFIAHKNIKTGQEILINYNGKPSSKHKVWFEK